MPIIKREYFVLKFYQSFIENCDSIYDGVWRVQTQGMVSQLQHVTPDTTGFPTTTHEEYWNIIVFIVMLKCLAFLWL